MVRVLTPIYRYSAANAGSAWRAIKTVPTIAKTKAKAAWPAIKSEAPRIAKAAAPVALPIVELIAIGAVAYHVSPEFKDDLIWFRDKLDLYPYPYAMATSAMTIGCASGLITQGLEYAKNCEKAEKIGRKYEGKKYDFKRLLGMTVLGAVTGLVLKRFYYFLAEYFPKKSFGYTELKNAIDQFIYTPLYFFFIYFPSANLIKGVTPRKIFTGGRQKVNELLPGNWIYWGLFALQVLYRLPSDLQIYAAQVFSLIWFSTISKKTFGKPADASPVIK
ncbi:MAG TPA: hypothetical protein VMT55_06050 [Candidatus Sulfotelmatobacter sp.]|nr:hypothetical protein [Candidatus Sulfotelmatobacter sp.]